MIVSQTVTKVTKLGLSKYVKGAGLIRVLSSLNSNVTHGVVLLTEIVQGVMLFVIRSQAYPPLLVQLEIRNFAYSLDEVEAGDDACYKAPCKRAWQMEKAPNQKRPVQNDRFCTSTM